MVREYGLNCISSVFKYGNNCYSVLTMKQLLLEALYLSLNKWKLNEYVNIGGVHINVYPLWSCQCDSADVGYLMPTKLYCNNTCHYDVCTFKISNLMKSINDCNMNSLEFLWQRNVINVLSTHLIIMIGMYSYRDNKLRLIRLIGIKEIKQHYFSFLGYFFIKYSCSVIFYTGRERLIRTRLIRSST